MNRTKITVAALAASLLAGPALAHDCTGRIDEFERLLDTAAEQAISASSGGMSCEWWAMTTRSPSFSRAYLSIST